MFSFSCLFSLLSPFPVQNDPKENPLPAQRKLGKVSAQIILHVGLVNDSHHDHPPRASSDASAPPRCDALDVVVVHPSPARRRVYRKVQTHRSVQVRAHLRHGRGALHRHWALRTFCNNRGRERGSQMNRAPRTVGPAREDKRAGGVYVAERVPTNGELEGRVNRRYWKRERDRK